MGGTVNRDHRSLGTAVHPYSGNRAALATMHGKEAVISPAFKDALGLNVKTPVGLDTDALGTFTGEVPRVGPMREVAVAKARLGMAALALPIGIASEGSYGPHPSIPFLPGGVELMVLVDNVRGIVIVEHLIDDAPVYDHATASGIEDLAGFLDRVGFPDQALIAKPHLPTRVGHPVRKGIRDAKSLTAAIADCLPNSEDGRVWVQTDMRAHMNPRRMAMIGRLAARLCERIASPCPACGLPGFGQIAVETGLPCVDCRSPTQMVLHQVFGCAGCGHRERRHRADGLTHADPGQCPECNP